jgi:hypothetical protein
MVPSGTRGQKLTPQLPQPQLAQLPEQEQVLQVLRGEVLASHARFKLRSPFADDRRWLSDWWEAALPRVHVDGV